MRVTVASLDFEASQKRPGDRFEATNRTLVRNYFPEGSLLRQLASQEEFTELEEFIVRCVAHTILKEVA